MGWLNLASLAGFALLAALAWLAGGCRRPLPWRTVLGSTLLMFAAGVLIFWLPQTRSLLLLLNDAALAVISRSRAGADFLFGPLAAGPGETSAAGEPSVGFVLAAQVLPAVVFFAALMALLYQLRLVQPLVWLFGRVFHRTLRLSGAESLAGSANVFFGVESTMAIRPYLERLTRSELHTVLTCGMCSAASTTLAVYVMFLRDTFPQIAGHLISASVIAIPAGALASKLMLPETDAPETLGRVPQIADAARRGNAMAALTAGAWDGLRLAAGIATLLVAVLGLVAVVDLALGAFTPLDLERILGWLFLPCGALLGIERADLVEAARLLGERAVLTEIPAYRDLARLAAAGAVSPRTVLILSYALCGFAHLASMGIFVGGIAALAPSRRDDLAAVGPRALVAATIATLETGALAGAFFHGQRGVLGL